MTAPEPPVTKYELTVKIRGNTHEEIEDELLTLVHGGYLLDSDYGKRDAWNSTSGRCTSVMVHTNPEQTPENYRDGTIWQCDDCCAQWEKWSGAQYNEPFDAWRLKGGARV